MGNIEKVKKKIWMLFQKKTKTKKTVNFIKKIRFTNALYNIK